MYMIINKTRVKETEEKKEKYHYAWWYNHVQMLWNHIFSQDGVSLMNSIIATPMC